jgi:NitT/TauT family transport system ATP-binding protein
LDQAATQRTPSEAEGSQGQENIIEVSGLSHWFPSNARKGEPFLALQELELEVRDQEFVCLLGPSGCGKSTLLNLIAGYQRPTSGSVALDGTPISGPGTDRVVVFQDFALFAWRTVKKNVEFGLEMAGTKRSERGRIAGQYLELVGLTSSADKFPNQLSGGMKQRTALARALAINPRVLLLDEPFGALDAQTRSVMQEEVLRIWRQHRRTIVFVTHSIEEAIYLADRIIVMTASPGRIKEVIEVDVPRERQRTSPQFAALRAEIEGILKDEIVRTMEQEK